MTLEKRLLTLYTHTFFHPGAGSTTGAIDLPVQREVHTGYPMLAGSGLKGSLREKAEKMGREQEVSQVFGPEGRAEDTKAAGCLLVGDARILAFPVRSLTRTFFWVTCDQVLARLKRDLNLIGLKVEWNLSELRAGERRALVPEGTMVPELLMLEEMDFEPVPSSQVGRIASFLAEEVLPPEVGEVFVEKFKTDLAVVSSTDFAYIVKNATQVSARIALDENKTTSGQGGNLWYEETIPPETVFYSLLMTTAPRLKKGAIGTAGEALSFIGEVLGDGLIQVGGNETVGQGWCLTRMVGGGGR